MNLYNEYQHKGIFFLTNYINTCVEHESKLLTSDRFKKKLRDAGLAEARFEDSLFNTSQYSEDNAFLFFETADGKVAPIRTSKIVVRATTAERAWLNYILDDPKTALFLDANTVKILKDSLDMKGDRQEHVVSAHYIDTCPVFMDGYQELSSRTIDIFRKCSDAYERSAVTVSGTDSEGTALESKSLIVYKLEYTDLTGTFALIGYSPDCNHIHHIPFDNITGCVKDRIISADEYRKLIIMAEKTAISERSEPITLQVSKELNGYDRSVYTFSGYKRFSYRDKDDNLILELQNYPYQHADIVEKLLFLGPAVTVLQPQSLADEMHSLWKTISENYS